MKKPLLIVVLAIIIFFSLKKTLNFKEVNLELTAKENLLKLREQHAIFLANSPFKKSLNLTKVQRKAIQLPPNKYYEREWELTMNPATGWPEPLKVLDIQKKLKEGTTAAKNPGGVDNGWVDRGPNNVGGRTRVVLFDPNDVNKQRVYAGGVGGGLWVNQNITNSNASWTQVSGVPGNMNISCITVDPNNSNTWYIGTGELYTSGQAVGNGVYKTTDGGTNWVHVPVQLAGGDSSGNTLAGIYFIADIIAWDNAGATELFIGVGSRYYGGAWLGFKNAGLYKSTDDGLNWSRMEALNLKLSPSSSYYIIPNDFKISADNTLWMGTIKARGVSNDGGKVFSSIDGVTWTLVTTLTTSNRIELAVSSTDENKIYALTQGDGTTPHIFVTTDAFSNTIELAVPEDADTGIPANDFTRGQAWYDLVIEVDPNNDKIVYVGGIDLFRTDQGENTDLVNEWKQISKWSNNNNLAALTCSKVHADQQTFAFRPGSSNEAVIGGDGGIYYASSLSTAETNDVFTVMNTGYNVTQFYYGGYGPSVSNELILAGAQDNGSQFINGASAGVNSSQRVYGGDGAYSTIDKVGGDFMIVSYVYNTHYYFDLPYNGSGYYIENDNTEGNFINPAGLDHILNIMYSNGSSDNKRINRYILGANSAIKQQLTNTLLNSSPTAFKVSPFTINSTTLLVGTASGKLLKLNNANNTNLSIISWEEITGNLFVGSISAIEFGETENDIFVTFHNYGVSSIWYSSNGGTSWVNKEGNFPDMPIKCILQNPLARNEVIIGTELGVWACENFNESVPIWTSSINGMRDVKVVDLDLRISDNSILATTHGRGTFTGKFTDTTSETYTLDPVNSVQDVCKSTTSVDYNFNYTPLGGYTTTTNISVSGIPSGAVSNLSTSSFSGSSASFNLTINNINSVEAGEYVITVTGVGGATVSKELLLIVRDNVANISTIAPVDGASQISITDTNLTWNPDSQAAEYIVDISTDAGFNTIIETGITPSTYYTIGTTLSLSTVYYWRVKASNNCNISDYSSTKNFITPALNDCTRPPDSNITIIPINSESTASSVINIPDDLTISKIKVTVNITHTWIQDLDITLISPNGTRSILFKNGCTSEDGLEVIFDNFASQTISDICGTEPVTGTIKPTETLSIFNDESAIGDWYLEVHDGYSGDEGSINSWSLEFCHAQVITNSSLTNATIVVGANTMYVLQQSETEATSSGSTAIEQVFMLSELPTEGEVILNNTPLILGDVFTQNDINTGVLTYVNTSSVNTSDFFKVDITNATGGFLPNQQINITINTALSVDDAFFSKIGILIFPTVSNGNFSILSKVFLEQTRIELYSITGQKVFSQELNFSSGNIEHINAQQLASGVYILKLTSKRLQGSKKIIIK